MTAQLGFPFPTLSPAQYRVWRAMEGRRGRAHAIKVPDLALAVNVGPRDCQALVKILRERYGVPICSTASAPAGYYLAETVDELNLCYHEHRAKALSTLRAMAALKRVALPELLGQLLLEVEA